MCTCLNGASCPQGCRANLLISLVYMYAQVLATADFVTISTLVRTLSWGYHMTSHFSIVLPDSNAILEMGLLTAAAVTQQCMGT